MDCCHLGRTTTNFLLLVVAIAVFSNVPERNTKAANIAREVPMIKELIAESTKKEMLVYSRALKSRKVLVGEVPAFLAYIATNSDYRSYHLLFALRRDHRKVYNDIPASVRVSILSSTLKKTDCLNDWGDLRLELADFLEYEPASALLEIGQTAVPFLIPLLDDSAPATLEGSEEATESYDAKYRRCDWACRFITLILNIPYAFSVNPNERDKQIVALRKLFSVRFLLPKP